MASLMNGSQVVSLRARCWSLLVIVMVFAGCAASTETSSPAPLQVSITTHLGDAQIFREGDPLSFFISLSSDAHVLLLYEDASGAVTQLVPNPRLTRTFVAAGDFISMPPPEAPFTLRVSAPFGSETVWLIASEEPLPGLAGDAAVDGVARLPVGLSAIRSRLRQHASRNRIRYGEASVSLTTRAQ